jgi:hypothetical protein
MTEDFEHFIKFSVTGGSSVENPPLSSVLHLLIGLLGLLVSNLLSSLYILDISPLLDSGLVKILSQSVGFFCPTDGVLCLREAFHFMRSHLSIADLRA